MYNSTKIAEIIKLTAKQKKITLQDMLIECELNKNVLSSLYNGKMIAADSLAKIANYLNVSTDYLLGLHDDKENLINAEDKKSFNTIVKEALYAYFYEPCAVEILSIKTGISADEIKSYMVHQYVVYDDTIEANCPTFEKYLKMLEFNPAAQKKESCLKLLFELKKIEENNINITEEKLREIIRDEISNAKISSHGETIKKA